MKQLTIFPYENVNKVLIKPSYGFLVVEVMVALLVLGFFSMIVAHYHIQNLQQQWQARHRLKAINVVQDLLESSSAGDLRSHVVEGISISVQEADLDCALFENHQLTQGAFASLVAVSIVAKWPLYSGGTGSFTITTVVEKRI